MKKLALVSLMLLAACNACSEAFMDDPVLSVDTNIAQLEDTEGISGPDIEEEVVDPSSVYPFPNNPCVQCQWYFCPPLDSVWQKQICIDQCADPPVVMYEGQCQEYLQCDPTQYHIEDVDCVTEDGYPGTQEKVCNKGQIQYADCITECTE